MAKVKVTPALVKALLARVPSLTRTAILNMLYLSPTKGKQDLRTELTVALFKSFLVQNAPISKSQRRSLTAPPAKGRIWISKATQPRPSEDDVLVMLLKAIEEVKDGETSYEVPDVVNVEGEWTGYRANVGSDEKPPDVSEEEKYKLMMKEVKEDVTILYLHGGAYYLMDPRTHRPIVARLAKQTGSRCFSVRYRLAPKWPFPAALLDALVAYLSLLAPPPGSVHEPVKAKNIVFAGDSAGGGLSFALLQALLTIRRLSPSATIRFHGQDVPVELPGGVAVANPWFDITRSLPAHENNVAFDYLPTPSSGTTDFKPIAYPEDDLWPVSPPRVDLYAHADALTHPFVCPLAAPDEMWSETPPIFVATGQDLVEDDGLYMARKLGRLGRPVKYEHFEGMPHVVPLFTVSNEAARKYAKDWAAFCVETTKGRVQGADAGLVVDHKGLEVEHREWKDFGVLTDKEVVDKIRKAKEMRVRAEQELRDAWARRIGPKL
ncbi:hypothetical protein KEM55_001822 [Ascosphaera atra]|nr:hypothetical protein KEM55_001822 [Ascosphaera atra]